MLNRHFVGALRQRARNSRRMAASERAFAIFYTCTLGGSALAVPLLYGRLGDAVGPSWAASAAAMTALTVVPLMCLLSSHLRAPRRCPASRGSAATGDVMKSKVAFIATGGTIASLGPRPARHRRLCGKRAAARRRRYSRARARSGARRRRRRGEFPRRFRAPRVGFAEWKELVLLCDRLVADHPDLAGIVIGHGDGDAGGNRLRALTYRKSRDPHRDRRVAAPARRPCRATGRSTS